MGPLTKEKAEAPLEDEGNDEAGGNEGVDTGAGLGSAKIEEKMSM